MLTGRNSSFSTVRFFFISGVILFLLGSCTVVKNYPPNKPFVYKTNINITGNIASDTAAELATRLKGQLDDSIRVRTVSRVLSNRLNKPPAYSSDNAEKSKTFMRALLNSLGYFRDTITYTAVVDTIRDQYRTTVTFEVKPGKVVHIDSFSYNIKHPELQAIAVTSQKDAVVKKGDPFAKTAISTEMDRLVSLYRDSGYLRFGREVLIGLWDTLDVSLLRPTFDPIEQLEILQKLRERRENPTANLEIKLKPGYDSSKLTKYYVGNITVYPDYGPDSLLGKRTEEIVRGVKVVSYHQKFRARIIPQNIYFRRGEQYSQQKYIRTINRFNSLGTWRLVNIDTSTRKNSDTADFVIYLTPEKKYSLSYNLEGSRNQSAVSGNLFGIGVNVNLQNRNFARAANIATTSLRYGIEVSDSSFIQTQQFAISHTIYFPRFIPRLRGQRFWRFVRLQERISSSLAFNASLTQRKDLFDLNSLNTSFGWDVQGKKNSTTYSFRPFNIEYSYLKPRQKLLDLFVGNPALKNIFTDGLILSSIFGVTINNTKDKVRKVFRVNAELSGPFNLFKSEFFDSNLYRFIKVDAEMIRKITLPKSALVLRLFAGVGYEFEGTTSPGKRNNLPFFKQYFAGGPNSMRAWGIRKLGRGSSNRAFVGTGSTPERYGDVQLEGNIEYRFPLFKPFGVNVDGALFSDIGNIWFLKKAADTVGSKEIFNFSRLPKDLAVGVGFGLRVDFNFFVVRLDYSYKAKDPSPSPINSAYQNKWFAYPLFKGDQFQLGISYPFIL